MELEDPKQSKEKSKAKAKKSKTHGKDEDETSNAGNDVFDEETQEIERSEMKDGQETSNEPGQTEEMEGVDESTQPELVQDTDTSDLDLASAKFGSSFLWNRLPRNQNIPKTTRLSPKKKGLCIMP